MATKTIPQLTEALTILDNGIYPYDNGAQTFKTKASTIKAYVNGLLPTRIGALENAIKSLALQNWQVYLRPDQDSWFSVLHNGFLYVAVGSGPTNRVATSMDGTFWINRTASQANTWNDIAYSPSLSLHVAVASDGTNRVMTSTNGLVWANHSAAAALSWARVIWAPTLARFIAISVDNVTNGIMTSDNGTGWTQRTIPTTANLRSIAWSESLALLVVVANTGANRVFTSPDGITWTPRVSFAESWNGVTFGQGKFVAIAPNPTRVMTSVDGITWVQVTGTIPTVAVDHIAYSNDLDCFVAVDDSLSFRSIWYSFDSLIWYYTVVENNFQKIHYAEATGRFITCGTQGKFALSLSFKNRA